MKFKQLNLTNLQHSFVGQHLNPQEFLGNVCRH